MNLNRFDYDLPRSLIAQHPLHRRDHARLMVIDRVNQSIFHDVFSNIRSYLPSKSMLVLNDSKVIPARLLSTRSTGGQVEIFLLRKLEDGYSYEVLMRPTKRLKNGEIIVFGKSQLVAQIVDKEKRIVRFNKKNINAILGRIGHIPLPPYISRLDKAEDKKYYQTVYAKKDGSVASPTAGLHFTSSLLEKIKKDGHAVKKVTLHVSYGTFKPVEEEDVTNHKMHTEEYSLSESIFKSIRCAKEKGRKIVSVGTTSCRTLETVAKNGTLSGSTNIFIYPGCSFQWVDSLITNFHLPKSTLLMLVYAFGGEDLMRKAYQEAIREKYRFYSYGDGMIIL